MNPSPTGTLTERTRFPRVTGDEPGAGVQVMIPNAFSPREWG